MGGRLTVKRGHTVVVTLGDFPQSSGSHTWQKIAGKSNICCRFEDNLGLFTAFNIFEPQKCPTAVEQVHQYGTAQLEMLLEFYWETTEIKLEHAMPQFATILLIVWSANGDGSALTSKASSKVNLLNDDTYRRVCATVIVSSFQPDK